MKRLILILLWASVVMGQSQTITASFPIVAVAATPALVQMKATPSDVQSLSGLGGTNSTIIVSFPNVTKVNNTIIVKVRSDIGSASNISITDNGSSSNTYTLQASQTNGSRTTAIFSAPVVNTSQIIAVTFASGTLTDDEVELYEFQNINTSSGTTPVDTTCTGTNTSGTAPACSASISPTSGDLLMTFEDVVTFSSTPTGSMTFTAQSGNTLLQADGTSWTASQWRIAPGGSVTPSITLSQATTRSNTTAVAFKAASAGSSFSGIHVNKVSFFAPEYANSTAISGTSQVIQFPCTGNSLWVMIGQGASGSTSNTTGVNDGSAFTALTNLYSSGDGYAIQWWHRDGVTCSGTESLTISFTSNPSYLIVTVVDISGATGYDSSATCGAGSTPCPINTSSASTTTVGGATITPSTSNGVILSYQNQDFDTIAAVSPNYFVADNETCPGISGGCGGNAVGTYSHYNYQGNGFEQDGALLVNYYSSTSAVSITWTIANTQNTGIGPYFSSTVAVKQ